MSHDASVISFFSSNYPLRDVSLNALRRLEMFKNLRQLSVSAIDGIDRSKFTNTYIRQYVRDVFHEKSPRVHVEIDELVFPLRLGDTRNLVLQLRMIAYHICSVTRECKGELEVGTLIRAKVEAVAGNYRVVVDDASVVLTLGIFGNMYLVPAQPLDPRSLCASQMMRQLGAKICFDELSQILDYFFAGIIAPGVIISRDHKIISDLVSTLGLQEGVRCITGINPKEYKMMRSLCDEQGTHNLRDDIINLGGGKGAFIVVEITCLDLDAQHIIREITEDTPSMTAFSTEKSALLKNGIFFAVHIQEEISSQIRSRASLVL